MHIYEGHSEFIEMTKDQALSIIYNILRKAALNNELNPNEYMVIDDDGVFIGNESDFDSDVLLYAIQLKDIIDFDNISKDADFIDLSRNDIDKILSNISN